MTVLDADLTAPPVATRPSAVVGLTMTDPLPGFPRHRDYVLVPADAESRLYWLQSLVPDGPRFLAVRTEAFFPEYAPDLPAGLRTALDLDGPAQAELFCLLTVPGGNAAAATVNLRAPVVVNATAGRGAQVVLTDGGHPIRRPLRR
jgi:flagellar assembly factor FliW